MIFKFFLIIFLIENFLPYNIVKVIFGDTRESQESFHYYFLINYTLGLLKIEQADIYKF